MIVKCILNDLNKVNNELVKSRLAKSIHLDGANRDLVIGGEYIVLALDQWDDGGINFYLHTVEESIFPYPYPAEFFEVIDPSISAEWSLAIEQRPFGVCISRLSFSEWSNDVSFYEKLINGDESALAIYKRYKFNLMT